MECLWCRSSCPDGVNFCPTCGYKFNKNITSYPEELLQEQLRKKNGATESLLVAICFGMLMIINGLIPPSSNIDLITAIILSPILLAVTMLFGMPGYFIMHEFYEENGFFSRFSGNSKTAIVIMCLAAAAYFCLKLWINLIY